MHPGLPAIALLKPVLSVLLLLATGGFAVAKVVQIRCRRQQTLPSPICTMRASIISKRAAVIQNWDMQAVPSDYVRSSMIYYVTFQSESGEQLEFSVQKAVYHALLTGDTGRLTFQGTQYCAFEPC